MSTGMVDTTEIGPHDGPQERFLASFSDIAIYGGAAGGGKSWALLAEPMRHVDNPGFGGVIFRETSTQVRNEGGLWDESTRLYPLLGAEPKEYVLEWDFPSGATISFGHLDHESDKLNWQGAQIAYIGFDELTQISEGQFWYLLSRNRSTCGVRPYVRATCNPDADSWVAKFIAWWINQDTGLPIPERSGVVRWFVRVNDRIEWADDEATLLKRFPKSMPKSVTFIAANLDDNPTLMEKDPGYRANLEALPLVDRERLLGGNWKIRAVEGNVFRRAWFSRFVELAELPVDFHVKGRAVRYWDKAGTDEGGDYTSGVMMVRYEPKFYVVDAVHGQWSELERERKVKETTAKDHSEFRQCDSWLEQEPSRAGKEAAAHEIAALAGYSVQADPVRDAKQVRWKPYAAQLEAGNVVLVRGKWNDDFIDEHCMAPNGKHDDQIDAAAGAFMKLAKPKRTMFAGVSK